MLHAELKKINYELRDVKYYETSEEFRCVYGVVLAQSTKTNCFATWETMESFSGETSLFWGHYFDTNEAKAQEDFHKRLAKLYSYKY